MLLPLVYIATLMMIGVTTAALAMLGSEHVTSASIRTTVEGDQGTIRDFVTANLTASEMDAGVAVLGRRSQLDRMIGRLAEQHAFLHVSAATPSGTVVLGDAAAATTPPVVEELRHSLQSGQATATISAADAGGVPLLTEAIPIVLDGTVRLVFEVQRDAQSILADAGAAWREVVLVTLAAGLVLAVLLRAMFHAAGDRLRRQAEEIIEARRRDPLTGLINHGAAVTALTDLLEGARPAGDPIGIALIDIDNFRLLNEVHGSSAGDEALLIVTRALEGEAGSWSAIGRFGPDEFLAIAPAAVARELPVAMNRVRAALEMSSLQFGDSERLPVTVSVGVTYFPFHATGVVELLSAATIALGEAKAGGGNETVIADAWGSEPKGAQTTFDVLQGLVLAIDHKDRYTKRHSEDVACYALFLSDRIGLDEEERAVVRTAGLLHDIGKIGIPDDILRKPGRLSPYEFEIVKQHVALGDLIVRDLPEIDLVRAGVRHHHERWDGEGYLDRLAGEQIPHVARILAVGDAFSAMTTIRPYRRALSVAQALDELRAAAGSQLDPVLVAAFVEGIEKDPKAPLPGTDRIGITLWTPTTRAA